MQLNLHEHKPRVGHADWADGRWATWDVIGVPCIVIQYRRRPPYSVTAKGKRSTSAFDAPVRPDGRVLKVDEGDALPPFDERLFFWFSPDRIRVIDDETCTANGTRPLMFTARSGVGPVILFGTLTWRTLTCITSPEATFLDKAAAREADRLATLTFARTIEEREAPPPFDVVRGPDASQHVTMLLVVEDCLCLEQFLGKAKLQSRLSACRELIEGTHPREAVPLDQSANCDVVVVYKVHMAPANAAAVARDIIPALVGVRLGGLLYFDEAAAAAK